MVALNYVADRLGLPASHFLGDPHPTWTRLEVDMRLAAGDWSAAADGYRALVGTVTGDVARAEVLRGPAGPKPARTTAARPSPRPPRLPACSPPWDGIPMRRWPATGWHTAPT